MGPTERQSSPSGARAVLNGLAITVNTCRLYPNPLEQPAFARSMALIREGLPLGQTLKLKVHRNRFIEEANSYGADTTGVAELASGFFDRGVTEIHFRSEPRPGELITLARLLSEEPGTIEAMGGAHVYLDQNDVYSIRIVDRQLEVSGFSPSETLRLPDSLRELIQDHRSLARTLETLTPEEAYERLRELLGEGVELSIDLRPLNESAADVVAAMNTEARASVIELAIGSLPDEFAQMIISQMSDGEIAESILVLSRTRPLDLVMSYAQQVVDASGGQRPELPVIVGKQLLEIGFDSHKVLSAFDSSKGGAFVATALPTDALTIQAAEEELGLSELREEAKHPLDAPNAVLAAETFDAILSSSDRFDDFSDLVHYAHTAVERYVEQSQKDKYVPLIHVLASRLDIERGERQELLKEVLQKLSGRSIVTDLLRTSATDEEARGVLKMLGPEVVSSLASELSEEVDQARRKSLIELLVGLAPRNPQPLLDGLRDPRWYVVRNCVLILGRVRFEEATDELIKIVAHPEPRVRREAVKAAALSGGARAVPGIVGALSDPDEAVRLSAVAALGMIRSANATEVLLQFGSQRASRTVRELKEALSSLRLQKNPKAVEFLRQTAHRKWPPTAATRELARHARDLLQRIERTT